MHEQDTHGALRDSGAACPVMSQDAGAGRGDH
jgi:hypothetical protein